MSKTPLLSIVVLSGLLFAFALPAQPASAWDGNIGFGPTEAIQGETTTFTVTVQNTGDTDLYVYSVLVYFCWNYYGGVWFKQNDGSPVTIANGTSHSFSSAVAVPQNENGTCWIEVEVYAEASGDWYPDTHYSTVTIQIKEAPSYAAIIILVILLVVLVVVGVGMFMLATKAARRGQIPRQPGPPQYPQPQRQPPPPYQQPGQYQRPGQPP